MAKWKGKGKEGKGRGEKGRVGNRANRKGGEGWEGKGEERKEKGRRGGEGAQHKFIADSCHTVS